MPNRNKHKRRQQHQQQMTKNFSTENVINEKSSDLSSLPYEMKHSDDFGRYLVASRDLLVNEIIIEQPPLAVGPISNDDNVPVCLNCYQALDMTDVFRCLDCQFPLCSSGCISNDHSEFECQFFKSHNLVKYLQWDSHRQQLQYDYETITVLRCLLLKFSSSDSWLKLNEMESLSKIRKENSVLWNRNQKMIVDRIRIQWKLSDEFSEEEIHTICGILEVNCFEVGGTQGSSPARALFDRAYLLCHDCVPNTNHTDDPTTHSLIIRSTRPIKKGEIISLSYAYTLQGTLKRRQHLFDAKFFWCSCERCKSFDELSTNASTLLCSKCTSGWILPTNPLDQSSEWRCRNCKLSIAGEIIMTLLTKIYDEFDAIGGNDIDRIERFLEKYKKTLHRNHYIFLSAKHSLCQLYGKVEGFLINELSDDGLEKKKKYCEDLLEVIDILEPGTSRLRGVVLYELHAPLMMRINREMETGKLRIAEYKRRLRQVVQILKESYGILVLEPNGSSENQMAVAAKSALEALERI